MYDVSFNKKNESNSRIDNKIIINSSIPPTVEYNRGVNNQQPEQLFPSVCPTSRSTNESFYKKLSEITIEILKTVNTKLIANIIDTSGFVIVSAPNLVSLISLLTGIDENSITISYVISETGCLQKYNPIKAITAIKVGNEDFNVKYNEDFNTLSNAYSISTSKVFIPII
jgi:hypothetical protein